MLLFISVNVFRSNKTDEKIDEPSPNLYIVSFASSNLHLSARRFYNELKPYEDMFKKITIHNEFSIDSGFKEKFKKYLKLSVRGFGYWIWKPKIILDTLEKMEENDVLIYADIGCNLNKDFRENINKYLQIIKDKNYDLIANQLTRNEPEKAWSSGDVLDFFGVYNNKKICDSGQIEGGAIIVVKNERTENAFKNIVNIFENNFEIFTDKKSVVPNKPEYKENRHDQSLFSLYVKTNDIKLNSKYSIGQLETIFRQNRDKQFSEPEDFRVPQT
jgi:hypothetical protein